MMTSLNITNTPSCIDYKMISTLDTVPGFAISSSCGPVEAAIERVLGRTYVDGGGVREFEVIGGMVTAARQSIAAFAKTQGADGIVGFRYEVARTDAGMSVLAYGTAVKLVRS